MINTNYSTMVKDLKKPGEDVVSSLTPTKADLLHMAVGVSGEAGELLDAVKKHTIYNKPLDLNNVIEELGDLEFYMEGLRQIINVDRETILVANMNKLRDGSKPRYASGVYSDTQAQERKDKVL